jgi:GntR family transcriptional regulator, sialic acid-inducible nan operon repressor
MQDSTDTLHAYAISQNSADDLDDVIVRHKLSDQVFEKLWHMIETGELLPGDAVPSERALMDRFKVGRPAVREALQSMANKGLISINHGERSRVNQLTASMAIRQMDSIAKLLILKDPKALDQLKEMRKLIELGTVRMAAERCTAQDADELREIVSRQQRKQDKGDDFVKDDMAFHLRIAAISGNPIIHAATQAMLAWLFEHHKPMLRWSGQEQTTIFEHGRLIDHIEKRDVDGAEAMMLTHLNRSAPLYKTTQEKGTESRNKPVQNT